MLVDERRQIQKVKQGNEKAFKKLYTAYANYALRTAYGITNNNNHAADIVQETFIKVYRNINQYDDTRPFKRWFYQILLNECRRYMTAQNKQAIAVESEQLLDYLHVDERESRVGNDGVSSALEQVSEMHRTVLMLKYLNGFTEKEIASLLELNVNTVKSRLYKARKSLRTIIGGEDDE